MEGIESLSREELLQRLRLAADLASAIDGLWFLAAERSEGFEKALRMDVEVWERYASVFLKRVRKYFPLPSGGLEGLRQIMLLDPLWLPVEYELIRDRADQLILEVKRCPFLEAMERMGRTTLTCEPVETAYLTALARAVDSGIRVRPLLLPPRQEPAQVCCRWQFTAEAD
jgi:hypothetical protein